tara:strand:+ start:976 stop:1332 length:357 start_codon:yes stop_codon:yes gene_type:complete
MTHHKKSNQLKKTFEQEVSEALKFYGFHLPETDIEIDNYVRMFGSTKIDLPDSIANAEEIFDRFKNGKNQNDNNPDVWALAAQGEDGESLPDHILEKLKEDIKYGKRLNKKSNGNKQQ